MPVARAPIVVTHEGGVRFSAQVRSHRIVVDQPLHTGGGDAGPSPIELLGASLGTCVAFYVHQFCHARELSTEGLRVEVEQYAAANPSRIGRFTVRVSMANKVPPKYVRMLEHVARSCPAHNTLVENAEISVVIESATALQEHGVRPPAY